MPRTKKQNPQELLITTITDAFMDKKANDPLILRFNGIPGAVCHAFMICHGTSRTQVEALADHVTDLVKKQTGSNPWHKEGFENAEWILIDYIDIVVHIFQEERRKFYNLEQLWGDAVVTRLYPGHERK